MITANDILPDLLETAIRLQIMALMELDAATFAATWRDWTADATLTAQHAWDESVLFGSHHAGEQAAAFNAIAKAYAALAFMPSGVDCFGQHYEATRP